MNALAVVRLGTAMDTSHARPSGRARWPFTQLLCLLALSAVADQARAHPAPFSYLDLHLDAERIGGTLVIHDFDAAYELGLEDPQALLEPGVARERADELLAIVAERLRIGADGEPATLQWRPVEVLPERQSLSFAFTLTPAARPGRIEIEAVLFPYDPIHQTFINVYEAGLLERQAILDANDSRFEHFAGTTQGRWAVVRAFVVSGVEHILIGPDHLLFLLGLLLLGGSLWRLATIITAFTLGHSVTLSLAALDVVRVAPALVEPAIALSIVVVGVDNLLVRQRRVSEPQSAPSTSDPCLPWLSGSFTASASRPCCERWGCRPAPCLVARRVQRRRRAGPACRRGRRRRAAGGCPPLRRSIGRALRRGRIRRRDRRRFYWFAQRVGFIA